MPPRLLAATVAMLMCVLAGAPASLANPTQLSVMQDDDGLVYGTGNKREIVLFNMQLLGVDAVRVTVLWDAVATRKRPRNPSDPRSYPRHQWDKYDELVRSAQKRGMQVYFNISPPGPRWAHEETKNKKLKATWNPNPREFGMFVRAVGRRYSGAYTDENFGRKRIPRVSWWSLVNEPNQGGWLSPQTEDIKGVGRTPRSPALYRKLFLAGAKSLLGTGHSNDLLVFGETAPLGVTPSTASRPLRPALFLREVFCLDRAMRRYRGRKAAARDCRDVRRLRILKRFSKLVYGHHPYAKTLPPRRRPPGAPEAITMANLADLPALLDRLAARTRLIPANLPIALTEFGYETSPPDPFNGVSPALQARYINEGDYLAYKQPRVFAVTQFQLLDAAPRRKFRQRKREYWGTYQSGLFNERAVPKPSAATYIMPFEVERVQGSVYTLWGQVRFTKNGEPQEVQLQAKTREGFVDVGSPIPVTNPLGFWELQLEVTRGAELRVVWQFPQDPSKGNASRTIRVR